MAVNRFRGLYLICPVVLAAIAFGADGPGTVVPPEPWAFERVAIKPSPQVTWGRLENGLRYAIMPHPFPPGRVSLRLMVSVGSFDEKENERGYAHFVEHMAFVGTKHFPPGELVKFLQRQGAIFGPHLNAVTTNTQTLYKLELPDNSAAILATGLRILRDFADGIRFEPEQVQRERGVVLSEDQYRRTDDEAEQLARTALLYRGTVVPDREPIGLMPCIENAGASALRKFYRQWYRPENMCVVVVGDVTAAQTEALLRSQFSSLRHRDSQRPVMDYGTIAPIKVPLVATHAEEFDGLTISLIKVATAKSMPPTWGTQLEGMRLHSAFAILARRLEQLVQTGDQAINQSSTNIEIEFGQFRVLTVKVSADPEAWERALATAEQEIRRVIEHGFDREELFYHQDLLRKLFRNSARMLTTLPSAKIAEKIANAMEGYAPFAFTGETLDIDLAMIERLTPEDCQRAFRDYWGQQAPRILITADSAHLPTVERVRSAYAASQQITLAATPPIAVTAFAYDDWGAPGAVVEKTYLADLDLWLIRLANGVRLNLKRTPFENGVANINVRIGSGSFREPTGQLGLRFWAGDWWAGGLGKHTAAELRRMGDGLDTVTTGADDGSLTLTSSARTDCLARALRELTAIIVDPAFRPEGHRTTATKLHNRLDPLWRTAEGPAQRFIFPSLAGLNPPSGFPAPETIFSRTLDEFQRWITPYLARGSIEVAIVGDFDVESVVAEFAQTFGTLPPRQPDAAVTTPILPALRPQGEPNYLSYEGLPGRPATLDLYWPIRETLTSVERRRLSLLAMILEDRVRDEVRGRRGATYSPRASFFASKSYPGLAGIRCTLAVKPAEALHYCNTVRDLAVTLEQKGITADELARASAQSLSALQEAKNDNLYWLTNVLSNAQENPESLADLRSAETMIAQTTVTDLNQLAHGYLKAEQSFRYIIHPSTRVPTAP